MTVKGPYDPNGVKTQMGNWEAAGAHIEEIGPDLLERGKAWRVIFNKGTPAEIIHLVLAENTRIGAHGHPDSVCETYKDIATGVSEDCLEGQMHFCENVGNNCYAIISAKKWSSK